MKSRTGTKMVGVLLAGLLWVGCDSDPKDHLPDPPDPAQVDDARDLVDVGAAVADQGREVLELLGLWPVYECGEPRSTFVGQVADGFALDHGCVSVSTTSGAAADSVYFVTAVGGCDVDGHMLSGDATLLYSGGTDRLDLEVDLTGLQLDGQALPWTVGYGVCGDEERVWAVGGGVVPDYPSWAYTADLTVALQAGFPVFGSDTLVLNGDVQLSGPQTFTGTFTDLEIDVGDYLPKAGTMELSQAGGHRVRAVFSRNLVYGQVTLYIDDHDPVTIPLL